MTLAFANTAWVHTREGAVLRNGSWRKHVALPVRVGLLERPEGIVLIDAGYSPEAITAPGRSLALRTYTRLLVIELLPGGDPEKVLHSRGYSTADVIAVIVTHFHVDHVSALARFPRSRIIANGSAFFELQANRLIANIRHGIFKELLPVDTGERIEDVFEKPQIEAPLDLGLAYDIFGDGSVLAVDLPGHAMGHFGVCFPYAERPLLYATDTQWLLPAFEGRAPGFPASLVGTSASDKADSTARVARFAAAGGEVMLCHDPTSTAYDI